MTGVGETGEAAAWAVGLAVGAINGAPRGGRSTTPKYGPSVLRSARGWGGRAGRVYPGAAPAPPSHRPVALGHRSEESPMSERRPPANPRRWIVLLLGPVLAGLLSAVGASPAPGAASLPAGPAVERTGAIALR